MKHAYMVTLGKAVLFCPAGPVGKVEPGKGKAEGW